MFTLTLCTSTMHGSLTPMSNHTCTVVVSGDGSPCGQPAVSTWTSSRGFVYAECADHCQAPAVEQAGPAAVRHPATRTTRPFVLVAKGQIVGYADSAGPAVAKRAAKLGATIVPVQR